MIGLWSLWLAVAAAAPPSWEEVVKVDITVADLAAGSWSRNFPGRIGAVQLGRSPSESQLCATPGGATLTLDPRRNPTDPCSALLALAGKPGEYHVWVADAARQSWTDLVLTRRDSAPTLVAPLCVNGHWVSGAGMAGAACTANGSIVLSQHVTTSAATKQPVVEPAPGVDAIAPEQLYFRWSSSSDWRAVKGSAEGLVFQVSGGVASIKLPAATLAQRLAELRAGTSTLELRLDLAGQSAADLGWKLGLAPPVANGGNPGASRCAAAPTGAELAALHPGSEVLPYVLCVDLSSGAPTWRMYSAFPDGVLWRPPAGWGHRKGNQPYTAVTLHGTVSPYLIPNVPVVVLAYPPAGQTVTVGAKGIVGLSDGAAYAGFKSATDDPAKLEATPSGPTALLNVLVPRAPGPFDVVVSASPVATENEDTPPVTASVTREMLVVPTYFGALRTGFSGLISPWEHGWAAVAQPDGSTVLTRTARAGLPEPELVVGFSTFYTRWAKYRIPDLQVGPRYRPRGGLYTGVGVLSQASTSGASVSFLRSLYFGHDVELTPHSSLAAAVVVRRTQVPIEGFEEGDLVPSSTGWSVTRPTVGFALTLNVTPWFFRQLPGAGLESVGTK